MWSSGGYVKNKCKIGIIIRTYVVVMTLDHFVKQSRSVFNRLRKYLQQITVVIIINEDMQSLLKG